MVAIVIVPADLKSLAEQAVSQLAPESTGESFIVPLKITSSQTLLPTHWACLPIVSNEAMVQIQALIQQPPFSPQSILGICDPEQVESCLTTVLAAHLLELLEDPKS